MTKRIFCLLFSIFLLASAMLPVFATEEEETATQTEVVTTLFIGSAEGFLSFAENCRLDSYSRDLQVELPVYRFSAAHSWVTATPFPASPSPQTALLWVCSAI